MKPVEYSRLLAALAALAVLLSAAPLRAQQAADVTDEAIDNAIARAINWLWSQQEADGTWPHKEAPDANGRMQSTTGSRWPPGEHMMAVLALEYAGTPLQDARFQKAVRQMLEMETDYTYIRSCRVVALVHLLGRMAKEKRGELRAAIKKDVDWLTSAQSSEGGWRYGPRVNPPRDIDFSNTQLAVLALSEAAKCGVEVPREAMERVQKRFIEDQMPDGGWNYGDLETVKTGPSYGSMTAASLASLFLTNEFLNVGAGCPCRSGRSGRPNTDAAEALKKGLAWMNVQFLPSRNPVIGYFIFYWLYQAERVGMATGFRYFGEHDWYREGAAHLLGARQQGDGSFGTTVDTSFALLFLVKGRGVILYNKLQFDGDWNLHPNDAAGLTRFIGELKEQSIRWQVIQSSSPVRLWYDAPVLYVTTESGFAPSDELKKKLRQYTDGGGTLLVEASCGAEAAKAFWQKLATEVWPEWEFKRVEKEHPLWTTDADMRGSRPALMHMDDGVRSIIFYSPGDISCAWHTGAIIRGRPIFDLGLNLAAYASDKAKLRSPLAGPMVRPGRGLAEQRVSAGAKKELKIARLKHGGDYYVGRNYRGLELLAEFLKSNAGLNIELSDALDAAGDAPLNEYQALWLSGRTGLDVSEAARTKLRAYLQGGGFLIAESLMGDQRFTDALGKFAADLGLETRPLEAADDLMTGRLGGAAGYDLSAKIRFSRTLQVQRIGKDRAALTGLYLDKKLVGVHSPYDVLYGLTGCPAYGRLGYDADCAMAVGANLILRLTTD